MFFPVLSNITYENTRMYVRVIVRRLWTLGMMELFSSSIKTCWNWLWSQMKYALTFRVDRSWFVFTVDWLVDNEIDKPVYNCCI